MTHITEGDGIGGPAEGGDGSWQTTVAEPRNENEDILAIAANDAETATLVVMTVPSAATYVVGYGPAQTWSVARRPTADHGQEIGAYPWAMLELNGDVSVVLNRSNIYDSQDPLGSARYFLTSSRRALMIAAGPNSFACGPNFAPGNLIATDLALSRDGLILVAGIIYDQVLHFRSALCVLDAQHRAVWGWAGPSEISPAAEPGSRHLPIVAVSDAARVILLHTTADNQMGLQQLQRTTLDPFGAVVLDDPLYLIDNTNFASAAQSDRGRVTLATFDANAVHVSLTDGWGRTSIPAPDPCGSDDEDACDDGDPCTADGCGAGGCTYTARAEGGLCGSDGSRCFSGSCTKPKP